MPLSRVHLHLHFAETEVSAASETMNRFEVEKMLNGSTLRHLVQVPADIRTLDTLGTGYGLEL